MNEELSMIVSLDIEKSASNIRAQLNALESKLKNDKIKITAEIDSDNLTKKLVKELDEARKATEKFKKQFDSLTKSMNDKPLMKDTEKDTQNIKTLGNQLEGLERQTRAFAKASGSNGQGLFSFSEFKDAEGNIERVDTSLKGMDGTVQKLKFTMDATGKAELFKQINLDKTEAELEKIANTMQKVSDEAQRADTLNMSSVYTDMAKGTMIASDEIMQLSTQLERNTITVAEAESKLRGYKNANDEAVSVDKKRIETIGKLSDMMEKLNKNNDRDMAFKNVAEGTRGLLDTARNMDELNIAMTSFQKTQSRFSSVQTENELDGLRRAIQDTVRETEEMARKFGKNMDWGESGISKYFDEMEDDVNHSTKELQGTLEKATDQLKVVTKEYKQALRMDSYGKDVGSGDKLKKLIDNDDITGVKRYISELSKMNAETVKLKQVTTNAGLPLKQLEVGFESSGQEMKKITYTIDDTVNGMNKLRQGFTQLDYNANRNLSTMQHFLVSLKRIPAYLASAYLFDGIRDGMRWVVQDIMQVEKELIEIQRVIDGGISLDELFTGSVEIANNLGNSMHDVINAVGELARTYGDFNEEQLLSVANTATLMSNVSELGVEESISSLVATMKAFNIEASDSIRIVDALNEVDNNFAISTTQLASAMNKSASTAKTFGVSMEENIGNITAIGAVTMESGEIIGKHYVAV